MRGLEWRDPKGRSHALLSPAPDAPWRTDTPRPFGLWPMLPFANRAFGGLVDDGESRFVLPLNDPVTGSAIHGFGWQSVWTPLRREPASVSLVHERAGAGDPYAYRAEFAIALAAGEVSFALSITNLADRPLPYGLGLHPWFPARPDTRLELVAAGEFVFAPGYRATGVRPFFDGGPYAAGPRFATGAEIAHSFLDWRGPARIATPSSGLVIEVAASRSLRHPVVWAPADAGFLCLEPQSHGIGAPGVAEARAATPLARLAPGESLAGSMTLRPGLLAG